MSLELPNWVRARLEAQNVDPDKIYRQEDFFSILDHLQGQSNRLMDQIRIDLNCYDYLTAKHRVDELGRFLDRARTVQDALQWHEAHKPKWNPEKPVWRDNKVLGSDGRFHLSECLLVEHSGDDYHCTCEDYS